MKPLFIPLRAEWYRAFEAGIKDMEFRVYGPRWNENTCWVGRRATLAYGYGHPRMSRVITGFTKLTRAQAPTVAKSIFPDAQFFAAIELH